MTRQTNPTTTPSDQELVIERVYDAPRDLVFRMWTEQEHVERWWGPNGFTTTTHEMDVRPGGIWRFVMHGPDGVDYDNKIAYREIDPPERLVYDHGSDGDAGQFLTTVSFQALGGKPSLTMRAIFKSAAGRNKVVEEPGTQEGGRQTLAKLAEYRASLGRQS